MVSRRRGNRRRLAWADDFVNVSIVSGGTGLLSVLNATLPTADQTNSTLVRSIICLNVAPVSASGVDENAQLIHVGIGVASTPAVGQGGAAVADPSAAGEEPLFGWVWRCRYWIRETEGQQVPSLLITEDIRASRKIESGQPYIRAENDPGSGTPFTVRVVGLIRTLYMLS